MPESINRDCPHYHTKQKECLLTYLQEHADMHVTVDQIAEDLHQHKIEIGRSTIYRYLEQNVQTGRIKKFRLPEIGCTCYQYSEGTDSPEQMDFFHMKCTSCGKLYHLECEELNQIWQHVEEAHGFHIDHARTVFYGLCSNCQKHPQGNSTSTSKVPLLLHIPHNRKENPHD